MKTFLSRTTFAALLATSVGAGFVIASPAAALAQASPAMPNFSYDTRNNTNNGWGGNAAYAQAPALHQRYQSGVRAWDSVDNDGEYVGQDPDPNVRLQLRRDNGLFDR